MDFVNQTINQLRDLFASMTPGARVTAALLLAVVVISLGYLMKQSTASPDTYLFGGEPIPQSQISRMEGAMAQAGLNDYEIQGNHIKVPSGLKSKYIGAIADAGELPADIHKMMYEALDSGSVFDDSATKRTRMKATREHQLSMIISQMPWVEHAVVLYNVQAERGLRSARQASASISIKPAVGEFLNAQRSRNIKSLVGSAHNIPAQMITITNLGNDSFVGGDGISPEDFDQPLYIAKAKVEQSTRNKIQQQLSFIPGVLINVNAELDTTLEQRSTKISPEDKVALLKKQEVNETSDQLTGGGGGPPGLGAQGPGRNGADQALAKQDSSKKSLEKITSDNVVGTHTEETLISGLSTKRIDASVAIPQSYVIAVFKKQELENTGTEPDKITPEQLQQLQAKIKTDIESIVKPLLPTLSLGEDDYAQAKVTFFQALDPIDIPGPSLADNALGLLGSYANMIGMAGVALVSLIMLRSIANGGGASGGPSSSAASLQLDAGSGSRSAAGGSRGGGGNYDDDEEEDAVRQKLKLRKGESLKDDLAEMVSGDPDAAAEILKNWISNAA